MCYCMEIDRNDYDECNSIFMEEEHKLERRARLQREREEEKLDVETPRVGRGTIGVGYSLMVVNGLIFIILMLGLLVKKTERLRRAFIYWLLSFIRTNKDDVVVVPPGLTADLRDLFQCVNHIRKAHGAKAPFEPYF